MVKMRIRKNLYPPWTKKYGKLTGAMCELIENYS
jgi:hypothetical protein